MSSRIISVEEINTITAAIEDKKGVELLREIRDNLYTDEDLPKSAKKTNNAEKDEDELAEEQEVRAFIGMAREDEILSENEKDAEGQKGILRRLEENGLVIKGGFIPLNEEPINSYKLTNEGYALIALVDKIEGKTSTPTNSKSPQSARKKPKKTKKSKKPKEPEPEEPPVEEEPPTTEGARLSNVVEENNKEENQEIKSFKAETNKEYGL